METFSFYSLILLGVFVFIAGFIDSIAGGGGLITLPAYIHAGLKDELLLGTNKMSSTLGTLVAAVKYFKEIKLNIKFLTGLIILAITGSALGARFISILPVITIKYLLILVLPPTAYFISSRKNLTFSSLNLNLSEKSIFIRSSLISFFISFYDGLLGPGTGTFFAVAFSKFCGYDLLRATALSKTLNLTSNLSALIMFLVLGKVNLQLGIVMGLVGMLGNYPGSHFALKKGDGLIRPMLFIISNAMLIKIIYDMVK